MVLRKYEYWINVDNSIVSKVIKFYYKVKWQTLGIKLRICVGQNTCYKGMSIAHACCIQINQNA